MSFQAYLDNIRARTGNGPEDFRRWANARGLLRDGALRADVKVGSVVAWLREDFALGHGHAMAIVAVLKGKTC
jgi:hypothetical protein